MKHSDHSRYAQHVRHRYAEQMPLLPLGVPGVAQFESTFESLLSEFTFEDGLRVLRHLVLERLLSLDCDQGQSLQSVMVCISELAEFSLEKASTEALRQLSGKHGTPTSSNSKDSNIFIVAMGKLAAHELNISSDIDLIYVYDEEGETKGETGEGVQTISNQQFFLKWAQLIFQFISKVSEHGFVFRIDLNLRPYGAEGLKVISTDALADYFQKTARPWERFAWYKSRCLGHDKLGYQETQRLITDFVHRKYLDYGLIESLRGIHQSIQASLKQNSTLNVKLARGGIREIEFGVQLLQMIRSGVAPELRSASTFEAIQLLLKAGILSTQVAGQLEISYSFLRRLEHRIQYLDDLQTHDMPANSQDLIWISQTMGFQEVESFSHALDEHRQFVSHLFARLLSNLSPRIEGEGLQQAQDNLDSPTSSESNESRSESSQFGPANNLRETYLDLVEWVNQRAGLKGHFSVSNVCLNFFEAIDERLRTIGDSDKRQDSLDLLSSTRRQKIQRILHHIKLWLQSSAINAHQLQVWFEWIEPLLRRDNYWSLFDENPALLLRVMQLMGASNWSQQYLSRYPGVVTELVTEIESILRFDANDFERLLKERREYLQQEGSDDEESLLALLRKAHHSAMFKILVQDLSNHLTLEEVADDLSALANSIVRVATDWIWTILRPDPLKESPLSVVAYGKLGSLELGYGSDLDLVFLYDETCGVEYELINKIAKKLITWFTLKTQDGDLYEIDSALRPNGYSGLLVSEIKAFERYQLQIDQNNAWTWEHQALTRARFCVGHISMQERFNQIRSQVLSKSRDPHRVKEDVYQMRQKMWKASKLLESDFDIKQSPGGMIDVEFLVQFLILSNAWSYPELLGNQGNIALLKMAQNLKLLKDGVADPAANAYRRLRQLQHQARLAESNLMYKKNELNLEIQAIQSLWLSCFERYW